MIQFSRVKMITIGGIELRHWCAVNMFTMRTFSWVLARYDDNVLADVVIEISDV